MNPNNVRTNPSLSPIAPVSPGRSAAAADVGPDLVRIDEGFAAALRDGAQALTAKGFLLCRRLDRHPYLPTLAVPLGSAPPLEGVAALLQAFHGLGLPPRVEFTAGRWPGLAPALAAAGLILEVEACLMRRAPDTPPLLPSASAPPAAYLGPDDPERLLALYLAGVAGPGAKPIAADEVAGLRRALAGGRVRAVAAIVDGRPVAGAALIGTGATVELGGVWTIPVERGRGLALAACRRLLADPPSPVPPLVWLAATPRARTLYARLGFEAVCRRLIFTAPTLRTPTACAYTHPSTGP